MTKFCRVCAGQVFEDSHHWVYLDRLGKFWLCPKHADESTFLWTEDVGYVYIGKAGERLVLGPYPYDRVEVLA